MEPREQLREVVAKILGVRPEELSDAHPLQSRRLQGSIGAGILRAAVKRHLALDCPGAGRCRTYGELESLVLGVPPPEGVAIAVAAQADAPAAAPAWTTVDVAPEGFACGVDIEVLDRLPQASDYWESEFHRLHFTDAEIAYCITQADPRASFAGRWCAKEAIRKCRPEWASLEMKAIEILREDHGGPRAQIRAGSGATPLPARISVSHADRYAVAIAVLAAPPDPPVPAQTRAEHAMERVAEERKRSIWARVLGLPGPGAHRGA